MRRSLWTLVGVGVIVRLVLGFSTRGAAFDIDSFEIVRRALADDPLGLYGAVNQGYARWPYPPLFLPWMALSGWLSDTIGLSYDGWVQLPMAAADAGIAWVVQELLRVRGASERARLAAVALVMFGPSFLLTTGYHGQIDSAAILPAIAALLVWERGGDRRALAAGLLIGVGGAIKVVPLVLLLPLVVGARSRREAMELVVSAGAVVLGALAPWLVADFGATVDSLGNRGFPGLGGISLIAAPGLADAALRGGTPDASGVIDWIVQNGWMVPAAGLAAATAVLVRRRPDPLIGSVIVWMVLMALGVNFALQYAVWGLPFLIAAGWLRRAAAVQVVLLPAAIVFYLAPWDSSAAVVVYCASMIAAWLLLMVLLAQAVRDTRPRSRSAAAGPQRPAPGT